jgi:hypothetical protein
MQEKPFWRDQSCPNPYLIRNLDRERGVLHLIKSTMPIRRSGQVFVIVLVTLESVVDSGTVG